MTTVEFKGINKYFPGVKALDDISFSAKSGKVYAFLGENGAGKSTLLKILNGDYIADGGQLLINSQQCNFESPKDALKHGVSVIYQERQILKEMTVAENVFLGDWIRKSNGFIDYDLMNKKTSEISKRFGLDIEPDEKVYKLSIAYQQMIEIMKAINRNSEIIAFDEPTAALSDKEITILFSIIEKLKEEGKVIFYVSHRMNEISQIADEVIVFKDGNLVGCKNQKDVTEDELIRMMVGRPLGQIFESLDRNKEIGNVCLELDNVTTDYVDNISFKARKGEVLGFAGLVGSGRTEIMNAVFGIDKVHEGKILLNNQEVNIKSPEEAIAKGIALVPEDRKDQGILPNISVQGNISISILKSIINKFGTINEKKESIIASKNIKKLNIKTPDAEKLISQLSGGNQQKVILARWLETNPQVLILDEPTKGIDVGAKAEFYNIIQDCAKLGMAVIVISSELQEIIGLSHRIIVIKEGRVSGELLREDASEESVLKLAMASEKKDDK
ncbi:MAG: sugar ABC transporter ATP-binding protein [Sphaerochaetaceae bacterium]|nr:sugar ABC transporter ATP-binding protein [Sphaerochaetaceae bacterium]